MHIVIKCMLVFDICTMSLNRKKQTNMWSNFKCAVFMYIYLSTKHSLEKAALSN